MNILYLANMRFPNEKAHGKQVREMCNALSEEGFVTLIIPTRASEGNPYEFGLNTQVRIIRIPTPNTLLFGRIGFLFMSIWFAFGATLYVLIYNKEKKVITREYACAALCSFFGIITAWETHRGEWNLFIRAGIHFGLRIICISHGLKNLYLSKKVPLMLLLVAPDGVDLSRYQNLPSREDARKSLLLPQNKKIAIYNGHLIMWKGIATLAQAAKFLPDTFLVIFMGGTNEDIALFKKEYGDDKRIAIIGKKSDEERPLYLRAADMTVLPNTAQNDMSALYTSPLKLFGYMASGTPIIASDLPSIREVLSDKNAYLVHPDNSVLLAQSIREVADHPSLAILRAETALRDVSKYQWSIRAKTILTFLSEKK